MRRRRGYRDKGTRVEYNVGDVVLTNAADLLSRLCGREGACAQMAWFSKSATVSFVVQKKGGELFHPMGRVIRISTSG